MHNQKTIRMHPCLGNLGPHNLKIHIGHKVGNFFMENVLNILNSNNRILLFQPQYYPPQPNQAHQFQNQNKKLSLPFPQKSNQLHTQLISNPNNKNQQAVYNVEGQIFQACMITPLGINDVQLISSLVFQKKSPKISIKKYKEGEVHEKDINFNQ